MKMNPRNFKKNLRDKRPVKDIYFKVIVIALKDELENKNYERYLYKDIGYLTLKWSEKAKDYENYHGFITIEHLKKLLGRKQWVNFLRGKRAFVVPTNIYIKSLSKI